MVRDPGVLVRLRRLQAEIAVDLSALKARERETRDLTARWDELARAIQELVAAG